MVIFGRSLFGGATSGHVLAMGLASALVAGEAVPEVTRLGHGNGQASASVAVQATKTQFVGASASVSAAVSGAAKVDYSGYGDADSLALGRAQTSVEYFLAGQASSPALGEALASKRMRVPTALMKAYASGEADGQNYRFADTGPMVAKASGFGTTYYVGKVAAKAYAQAEGAAFNTAGARTQGQASASATGECRRTAGAQGDGLATVLEQVDAAVKSGNTRKFECFGFAEPQAAASVSHTEIYQNQNAYIGAEASRPAALQKRGGKGAAVASCSAIAEALGTVTAAVAKPGNSQSASTGDAQRQRQAEGSAQASAAGWAEGRGTYSKAGSAVTQSTLQITAVHLGIRVHVDPTASLQGAGVRVVAPQGTTAAAVADISGFMQVNDLTKAPSDRTVVLDAEDRLVSIDAQPRLILI